MMYIWREKKEKKKKKKKVSWFLWSSICRIIWVCHETSPDSLAWDGKSDISCTQEHPLSILLSFITVLLLFTSFKIKLLVID